MTVRFKMTDKGEIAILPRKDYEALAAKAKEADEDFGTARLVARVEGDLRWHPAHSEKSGGQNCCRRKCAVRTS
jgi:hypothetical protein